MQSYLVLLHRKASFSKSLSMKVSEAPIQVEQDFQTDLATAWAALTDITEMKKWYFDNIPDFQARAGFKTQFLIHNEGRTFTHCWEVLEVTPQQLITYRWNYLEYSGDSTVTFVLTEIGGQVRLNFSMEVLEDFPDGILEFERASGVAGWEYFIKKQLKGYLEG